MTPNDYAGAAADQRADAMRLLAMSTADNPVTAAEAQTHATLALGLEIACLRALVANVTDEWMSR